MCRQLRARTDNVDLHWSRAAQCQDVEDAEDDAPRLYNISRNPGSSESIIESEA